MADARSSSAPNISTSPIYRGTPAIASSTVTHPTLTKPKSESVRVFLRQYDSYVNEVKARAESIAGDSATCRPVALKFCVDAELVYSLIELERVQAYSYDALDDETLRIYLGSKSMEKSACVSMESLDALIKKELKTDMSDGHATSRMENLFISYNGLLRRHGLSWLPNHNPKMAVRHVLAAVKPESLRLRLDLDLRLRHPEFKSDLSSFMKHAIRLADAFDVLDIGPKGQTRPKTKNSTTSGGRNTISKSKETSGSRQLPLCQYGTHKEGGLRHLLRDCRARPEVQREILKAQLRADRSRDGPSSNTRSRGNASSQSNNTTKTSDGKPKTVGRMKKDMENDIYNSSCPITIFDSSNKATKTISGRCDDGSNSSLVSPCIAESSVIQGIGSIKRIDTIELTVALKD